MDEPQQSADFVKRLLAQEPSLDAPSFADRRRLLLARLLSAEQRERRGRRIVMVVAAAAATGFSLLFAAAVGRFGEAASWPDWAKYLGGVSIILLPFLSLLLTVIYFFRHRRELRATRDEAFQATLEDLPRQIEELRAELETLRQRTAPRSGSSGGRRDDRRAFTLIEMMTVLAIIGVLAGLLLPALARAKAKGRALVCASNLGQIGKALIMYEHENGAYPGAGWPVRVTNQVAVVSQDSWEMRVRPGLTGNTDVFSCPGYQPPTIAGATAPAYGYNANGSARTDDFRWDLGLGHGGALPGSRTIRAGDVRAPADMVAIGDIQSPPGVWFNTITPNLPQRIGGQDSIVPDRHDGGANMVFCDGHTEAAHRPAWTRATENARRRWNIDGQPHPETW